ncbi:MAG TPA: hypothetical protein VNN76_02690 [Bacteroidota bacterium]|nr:hypothetical protein [Bacteroidota bacterium]
MRPRGILLVLLLFYSLPAAAQAKREPDPRRPDVARPADTLQTPTMPLPKIELPEYVITGVATVDVPSFQKEEVDDAMTRPLLLTQLSSNSEKEISEFLDPKRNSVSSLKEQTIGKIEASLGTYFTPSVYLGFGQEWQLFRYRVVGDYYRTMGFADATDRSQGRIGGDAAFTLRSSSEIINGMRIRAGLSYGSDDYKFYGSLSPFTTRSISALEGSLRAELPSGRPWTASIALSQHETEIRDSSFKTSERATSIFVQARIPLLWFPLTTGFHYQTSTVVGLTSRTAHLVDVFAGVPRQWWHDYFAEGSLHLYYSKNMSGGWLYALYPQIMAGYRLGEQHVAFVGVEPAVSFRSLLGDIRQAMYLSTEAVLRNRNVKTDYSGGVESDWSGWLRTKGTVRYNVVVNEPILEEASKGIWFYQYTGEAEYWTLKAEAFANVTPNDYFALALTARTSEISTRGSEVPYIPSVELVASYRRLLAFGVEVSPEFHVVGERKANLAATQSLPSYGVLGFRVTYSPLKSLVVFLKADNITNTRYQVWRGYDAEPQKFFFGLGYTW